MQEPAATPVRAPASAGGLEGAAGARTPAASTAGRPDGHSPLVNLNQVLGLRDAFDYFDTSRSGHISGGEVRSLLHHLDVTLSAEQALKVLREIDSVGLGYLNFARFLELQSKVTPAMDAQLRLAFARMDTDGDGYVTVADVKRALEALEETPSDEEVQELLAKADPGREGHISFEQFIKLFGFGGGGTSGTGHRRTSRSESRAAE